MAICDPFVDYAVVDGWTSITTTQNAASISPSASVSPYVNVQALTTGIQNQLTAMQYNAKYVPPTQTWSNTFISAGSFGPSGTGYVEEMPKGNTPADRLKRALMIASGNHAFWNPMQQVTLAYAPGYVKSLSKLDVLKNNLIKNVCTPLSQYLPNANTQVGLYAMAIKAPNSEPVFTYMTFHAYDKYATTFTLDMGEDMLVISNTMLFIASQHREFSIGVVPCQNEEPTNVLKAVKEFLDGFCDINIKPLMTNLVYEFMGNVIFLAPSKRVASLAKALFSVKYITSMSLSKYKDENIQLPMAASGGLAAGSVYPISGGSYSSPYLTAAPSALTYMSGNSSNTNTTWTKLANSVTSSVANIKNYFTSSGVSS